ncbi:hypothetical protein BLNAU_23680 [Blattamonas nauphoetae]|uniref:Uncharacterized protein n=1 Tax=Blattamonas nauphoetae TaxID=2049346 RepID=A0ABQ9WRN0_9EUKA|nr:hypothetical protein BLNAU_23680 [Blattamonas nauphoetae]
MWIVLASIDTSSFDPNWMNIVSESPGCVVGAVRCVIFSEAKAVLNVCYLLVRALRQTEIECLSKRISLDLTLHQEELVDLVQRDESIERLLFHVVQRVSGTACADASSINGPLSTCAEDRQSQIRVRIFEKTVMSG